MYCWFKLYAYLDLVFKMHLKLSVVISHKENNTWACFLYSYFLIRIKINTWNISITINQKLEKEIFCQVWHWLSPLWFHSWRIKLSRWKTTTLMRWCWMPPQTEIEWRQSRTPWQIKQRPWNFCMWPRKSWPKVNASWQS